MDSGDLVFGFVFLSSLPVSCLRISHMNAHSPLGQCPMLCERSSDLALHQLESVTYCHVLVWRKKSSPGS